MAGVIVCAAAASGPARATTFSATELSNDVALLSQFNLITLGNYTNTSGGVRNIDGRAIVVGNATTTGASTGTTFCNSSACAGNATQAVDASKQMFGALTVFGNVAGNFAAGHVNGGTTSIKGTQSGYFYMGNKGTLSVGGSTSGLTVDYPGAIRTSQSTFAGSRTNNNVGSASTPATGVSAATVFPFSSTSLTTDLKRLATGIAALPGSPGVNAKALPSGDNIFFSATNDYIAGGKKYGVVTTTLANLASETNFKGIDNGTNDATFVIVTGDGANYTLPNLNSYAGANKVIFDFVDATTLKFAGNWSGSILAPLANITQMGGTIDGSVVVNSINQSQALYATNLFTGSLAGLVPEPASLALIGLGVAAAAMARRRRVSAAA